MRSLRDRVNRHFVLREFRRHVLTGPSIRVRCDGEVVVRTFLGRRSIIEAIASLKSFYRFAPEPYALVVHEDGSLTRRGASLLRRHFPGVRIVPRRIADREVIAHLEKKGFSRCAELRRKLPLALKFFDVPFYGVGQRVVYIDSDVLFLQPPTELLQGLHAPSLLWKDRFAVDIHTAYSWTLEALERCFGIPILPSVNSGLLLFRRVELSWSQAELCLRMPALPDSSHYLEQSLFAVDFSHARAEALPPEYDVCFRHTWRDDYDRWLGEASTGHEVVSQHYCGSARQRAHFYRHFIRFVAPHLLELHDSTASHQPRLPESKSN